MKKLQIDGKEFNSSYLTKDNYRLAVVINSFIYFLIFCGISLGLCGMGYMFTVIFQTKQLANEFFISWVFYFNGIFVGGFGYGLMWYIKKDGKNLLAILNNLIDISKFNDLKVVVYSRRANSWKWKNIIGIPVTILGGFILWNGGYPLLGFSKFYLAICSISIYYVATYIFTFFIFTLLTFKSIEENLNTPDLNKNASPLEYESVNNFFIVASTMGIFAIYFGFRGTLTANFSEFILDETLKKFLILPIILFLPITLVFSFYPRYVLKKLHDIEIMNQIRNLDSIKEAQFKENITIKEQLETERMISDIKEKLISERKQLPILSYKDSPSLVIVLLMIIQFIIQYDHIVNDFFNLF